MAKYVISDIHGQKAAFEDILEQINFSDNDEMYILGDVIDRGPYGVDILKTIMKTPNMHMLLGNHELFMSLAMGDDGREHLRDSRALMILNEWISQNNGGRKTYAEMLSLSHEERHSILEFVNNLPIEFNIEVGGKKYHLVHASSPILYDKLKEEGCELKWGSRRVFSVWDRDHFNELTQLAEDEGFTVIFGHTPTLMFYNFTEKSPATIIQLCNLIDIDCGSAYIDFDGTSDKSCRLACLRLDDMAEFYSTMKSRKRNK